MKIEKLDSYVLSPSETDKFFNLTQHIYEIRITSDPGQTCRQIETYRQEENISEGILLKKTISPLTRIILFLIQV